MIVVEGLCKRFGQVVAVDGISFTARDGSVTGLLGPNGAGKTTTLRLLCGLMRPDAGRIDVDGVDAVRDPLKARGCLGVLPEAHGLYPRLTAREHLRYFARLQGLAGTDLEGRAEALLQLLEMDGIADRRAEGFSHGERMKVSLGRALIHDPGTVILDEPTNGLDVRSTRTVRRLIRQMRAEGRCVLFSSHIMQEVSALCDHIVIIGEARVVAEGSPDEIRRQSGHQSLEDAFVALTGLDEVRREQ